jgi:hypothetical protein
MPRWPHVASIGFGLLARLSHAQGPVAAGGSCPGDTLAIRADSALTSRLYTVAPGVTYQCLVDRRGPWAIHVVRVLRDGSTRVDAMRATGRFTGRERVSEMAARWTGQGEEPLIGLNADFFNLQTGEVVSTHVEQGGWVKGITRPDTVGPPVDNARSQVAVLPDGRVVMGRFELHGQVRAGGRVIPLLGINAYPPGPPRGAILFTPWYGDSVGADSGASVRGRRVVLRQLAATPLSVRYRAVREVGGAAAVAIPTDGAVLVTTARIPEGGVVEVRSVLGSDNLRPQAVVGGWGRLLEAGRNVAGSLDMIEGTRPDFSAARHPRTAVGTSADGHWLLLMVVDGRRPWSVGMSLDELARTMRDLGAWDAVNLDGGGSTTLWVGGRVVNAPSDPRGERAVGNALWVLRRRARSTP